MTRVLWVDDDCKGSLAPLAMRLRREGLIVSTSVSYDDAATMLKETIAADRPTFDALLVDIVLPKGSQLASLEPYFGLLLANEAVEKYSMKVVCFLTVVSQAEIFEEYQSLKKSYHKSTIFSFFDKVQLLERNRMTELLEVLRGGESASPES